MTTTNYLTRKEELILLAVHKLGDSASLVRVLEVLYESTGREWTMGNVYVPLDRMTKLGYLKTRIGESTARRGGKAVRYYTLTRFGKESLSELKRIHDTMWNGITDPAPEN
ncbi:MAG: PadR family transcriptional regulator [Candidatus Aminicenantes bacterium]|nr:PadR family transcriptional regulator [Candidatus Aminicenantes bacterium]